MRCQWGLTWDTMKPWIAARRYKEFNFLDTQVCRVVMYVYMYLCMCVTDN